MPYNLKARPFAFESKSFHLIRPLLLRHADHGAEPGAPPHGACRPFHGGCWAGFGRLFVRSERKKTSS